MGSKKVDKRSSRSSATPVHSSGRRRKRGPIWRDLLLRLFPLFLMLGCCTAACGYYSLVTYVQGPISKFIHPVSRGADEPSLPSDDSITGQAWNILLLGSDNDGKYTFPALLTQVMMVVHIDPFNNTVALVSIPRDSWVPIPQVGGMHKIDQAFLLGASQKNSFDDGVRIARMTVEHDYGIPIDRYAWVGLSGFARVIDRLGGVDIYVTHPMLDDSYPDDTGTHSGDPYAFNRLYFAPGPQHLNGLQALEYVRSRHADLVGDIGRIQRQQQVLEALKKKLDVTSLISRLPQLIADLHGSVYTDLSEQDMLAFAVYARTLSSSAIAHVTFGPGRGDQDFGDFASVYDPTVNANQDVIVPRCDTIQPVLIRIFGWAFCNVNG
jgi:polyisoprenyl-teichoic acid--peptidoglycan teichoic acid transferase